WAVTGTMTRPPLLFYALARESWHWSRLRAGSLVGLFLLFDLSFLGPNLMKIPAGGWFPLVIAGVIFVVMTTWKRGRAELARALADAPGPFRLCLRRV